MGRVRVLWLIKGLGPGGAEHLLVRTACVADHDRFDYDAAYLLGRKDHLVGDLEHEGVSVHWLGVRTSQDPRWLVRLWRLHQQRRYDIVHVHSPLVAGAARLALRATARSPRPRLVSTEHNVWGSHARATRWLNAATCRLDDARLAVSEQVRNSMPPPLRTGVEVVVQGLLPDQVRAAAGARDRIRAEVGAGPADVLVVTVANLRRQKGYPDLLRAARQVLDQGLPVRFVAAGQGPQERELRALHAHLGLDERFRFLGYRPDALEVLAAGDVFVLASRHEGFPIALMEALVAGLPVVITDVGGAPQALSDREALVVPPGRPDRLAGAIQRLATDSDLRARMGAAATEAGARYDIRDACRQTEKRYLELAAATAP